MRRFAITLTLLLVACGHGASPSEDHTGHAPQAAPVSAAHAGHGASGDGGTPEGYSAVTLDPAQAAALGLATAAVEERDFKKQLRTTGVIALDETRTAHVHPKVRGWIDGIQVNFVGKSVAQGQPLCSIYSQEVFAAETEFLSILDRARAGSMPTGEFADAEKSAQSQLVEAARRRLAHASS